MPKKMNMRRVCLTRSLRQRLPLKMATTERKNQRREERKPAARIQRQTRTPERDPNPQTRNRSRAVRKAEIRLTEDDSTWLLLA